MRNDQHVPITGNLPRTLILDTRKIVQRFITRTSELDMPTIDIDATLQVAFDFLRTEKLNFQELDSFSNNAVLGESLVEIFENLDEDNDGIKRASSAVLEMVVEMKTYLNGLGVYRNGEFPYTFRRTLNDTEVELARDSVFPKKNNPGYRTADQEAAIRGS